MVHTMDQHHTGVRQHEEQINNSSMGKHIESEVRYVEG